MVIYRITITVLAGMICLRLSISSYVLLVSVRIHWWNAFCFSPEVYIFCSCLSLGEDVQEIDGLQNLEHLNFLEVYRFLEVQELFLWFPQRDGLAGRSNESRR